MREERRKEPRLRRRVRLTLETADRRVGGVSTNLSERGLAATLDGPLRSGVRAVVTVLLPGGRVSFDAVVRHAGRADDGASRVGLELSEPAPAAYRRFVREERDMLLARSGAAIEAGEGVPAEAPRAGKRHGIPSPVAMRAQGVTATVTAAAAAAVSPPPTRRRSPPATAAAAVPIGRLRPAGTKTRRSTPRGGAVRSPRTPSRGAQAAASPLARLEPGLHGIATARLAPGDEVDAIAAAAVVREAIAHALDGLLPASARLVLTSLELDLEEGTVAETGASLTAAVRLEAADGPTATARFVAEVSRRGRTAARGRVTVRIIL